MTGGCIILADGSWGDIDGAVIFTIPDGFDMDEIQDEHDVEKHIVSGNLPVVARIETDPAEKVMRALWNACQDDEELAVIEAVGRRAGIIAPSNDNQED